MRFEGMNAILPLAQSPILTGEVVLPPSSIHKQQLTPTLEFPTSEVSDPFEGFDFGDILPASPVAEIIEPEKVTQPNPHPSNVIDRTALFTHLQKRTRDISEAMETLALVVNSTDCVCPPQNLNDGRVVHGNIMPLFNRKTVMATDVQEKNSIRETNKEEQALGITVTSGCKEGYVHVYFEDGTYREMLREDTEALLTNSTNDEGSDELSQKRNEKKLRELGLNERQISEMQFANRNGFVDYAGHAENGCCSPASPVSSELNLQGFAGKNKKLQTSSEDHSEHAHCSKCGEGHVHEGKCEKCGASQQQAA